MIDRQSAIHILCGIQGSGKTTLSKQLALEHDAVLYCYDKLPKGHWSNDVHHAMYERIAKDLRDGKSVVCDDLHTTIEKRKVLLDSLNNTECVKIIHVMRTPLDVCIQRNRERDRCSGRLPDIALIRCYERYEPPSFDEGWDEIIYN